MDTIRQDRELREHRIVPWLTGAAIGVLLVLLIAPSTRWILFSQARLAIPTTGAVAPLGKISNMESYPDAEVANRTERAVLKSYPNDLLLQIGGACLIGPTDADLRREHVPPTDADGQHILAQVDSNMKTERLRRLEARFPNRPELYATVLRTGQIMVQRAEEDLTPDKQASSTFMPADARWMEQYLSETAAGERSDPDNGFFPYMSAVGLFNLKRDAEAMAAVHRAAGKPIWREYLDAELTGETRLVDLAFGNRSALLHLVSSVGQLRPHNPIIKTVGRMELYYAFEAERAGRPGEGLAIRRDLLRCGRLLRTQATCLNGNLLGCSLERLAITEPDGVPDHSGQYPADLNLRQQLDRLDSTLRHGGPGDQTEEFRAEMLPIERLKSFVVGDPCGLWPSSVVFLRLVSLWTADLLVLSNVLWLLIFGGAAAMLLTGGSLKAGLPLDALKRWSVPTGVVAGGFIAPIVLGWHLSDFPDDALSYRIAVPVVVLILAAPSFVLPVARPSDRLRRCGIFLGCILLTCLALRLAVWQVRGTQAFVSFIDFFSNLGNTAPSLDTPLSRLRVVLTCGVAAAPLVPLVIMIAASVVSMFCRVPASVGMARALRGLALPVASVLLLGYGLLLLPTLRNETLMQSSIDRTMRNEGQYLAEIAGKTWPDLRNR